MNSSGFRRALRRHTHYNSPADLYAAILLVVGKPEWTETFIHGAWYTRVIRAVDECVPPHISMQASNRFAEWVKENYDAI